MGFVIVIVLALYILIAMGVVAWAISYAKKNGKSAARWGWGAALGMYLLVFWDWIPTVVAHKYYCETQAGFWVYKTPEQWNKENPGVMETLIDNSPQEYPNWPTEIWKDKKISSINQRFGLLYTSHKSTPEEAELFLNIWRWKYELIDKKTGAVMAKSVDFSSGNGNIGGESQLKFWLHSDSCISDRNNVINFAEFVKQFRGAKK